MLEQRGIKFDEETMAEMEKASGAEYKYLTSFLFRQTIAALERSEGNWDFAKRFMPQLT